MLKKMLVLALVASSVSGLNANPEQRAEAGKIILNAVRQWDAAKIEANVNMIEGAFKNLTNSDNAAVLDNNGKEKADVAAFETALKALKTGLASSDANVKAAAAGSFKVFLRGKALVPAVIADPSANPPVVGAPEEPAIPAFDLNQFNFAEKTGYVYKASKFADKPAEALLAVAGYNKKLTTFTLAALVVAPVAYALSGPIANLTGCGQADESDDEDEQ